MSDLTVLEKATLQALAGECGYSLHGSVSKEDVTRHFPGHLKGDAKKALESLNKNNYCYSVGGKKNKRYKLTKDGQNLALNILEHPTS